MVKCTTDGYAHCFPLLEGVCMYMHTLASGYISILCIDACMNDHLLMLHSQASPAPRSSLCVKDSKWRGCLVKTIYKRQLFAQGSGAYSLILYKLLLHVQLHIDSPSYIQAITLCYCILEQVLLSWTSKYNFVFVTCFNQPFSPPGFPRN